MPQDRALLLRSSRNSLKRARTRSLKSRALTDHSNIKRPSPPLPLEIIEAIFGFFFETLRLNYPSSLCTFDAIAPLTLVSSTCRLVALRQFLRHLCLGDVAAWDSVWRMVITQEKKYRQGIAASAGLHWTRSIASDAKVLSRHPWRLSFFSNLETLCIDLSNEGLVTQHSRIMHIFSGLEAFSPSNTITSLHLSAVPRIDVPLLSLVSERLPALTNLRLTSTERLNLVCCWICFEDSLTCTIHSPVPDFYPTPETLASSFANALIPLKYLTHLHLGIFLCDEQLLWSHMDHAETEADNVDAVGGAYDCEHCEPYAKENRRRELAASLIMALKLKSLKAITWDAFYGAVVAKSLQNVGLGLGKIRATDIGYPVCDSGGDGAVEHLEVANTAFSVTTVWIWRRDGRVRAKTTPWT